MTSDTSAVLFRCSVCSRIAPTSTPSPWCPCGGTLDLTFTPPRLDIRQNDFSFWRYADVLPVRSRVSIGEPITPVVSIQIAGREVLAKVDFLFPTGSFKDRGSAILVSSLLDAGVTRFLEDSSGNAGASMATYAARAGIRCEIFCPESASPSKLLQVERTGATIHRIPGSRAATTEAVLQQAGKAVYASHNWNPFFLHGTKTMAYEIAEQMAWSPPEHIVAPAGGGSVLLGLDMGFRELLALGKISRLPFLHAVQAESCALMLGPVSEARPSLAEGILAVKPPRLERLKSIVTSAVAVSEAEIRSGFAALARQGIYVEPTSSVVYAGLEKLKLPPRDRVLVVLTGSGLKFAGSS